MGARLWLRWSLRDLRLRWPVVVATALVLAIGAGLYSTMGAMEAWRTASADASFAALDAHDLRVTLDTASFTDEGRLAALARDAAPLRAAEERLSVPTSLDASRPGRPLLVTGRLVGSGRGEVAVDRLAVQGGRPLRPADRGESVAVLEENFAEIHDVAPPLTVRVGGRPVRVVGRALAPEWFIVSREGAVWGAERRFGVVFTTLATAQRLSGQRGKVNEVVVRLAPGADAGAARRRIEAGLAAQRPALHGTVTSLDAEDAHAFLYRDAENDQRVFLVFALLILGGAALGTFNLISRVVDAQRREIGVGMALGVPPALLARRPLLLGAQIAVLGTVAGVGVAMGTAELFKPLLADMLPLPVIRTPFQTDDFAVAALLSASIPLVAAALAVGRAVRLAPVDAIRSGFRAAKGAGWAGTLRRIPLPGGSVARMPVRDVVRAPRRTLMTVAGVAVVLSVIVALGGMIDSLNRTTAQARAETEGRTPDRLVARLDGFAPVDSPLVEGIAAAPSVGDAEPSLVVPAAVSAPGGTVRVELQLQPAGARLWRPTVIEGDVIGAGESGVLLSERAAENLGVEPGDRITLRHPVRTGEQALGAASTPAVVAGIHGNPFRQVAVADASWARRMRLDGTADVVSVTPAPGRSAADVQAELAGREGVAGVEEAATVSRTLEEAMGEFSGVLQIGWVFAVTLALLLAFNTTAINVEERRREHATMFAYGLRPAAVLRTSIAENVIVGVLATLAGIALGRVILHWIITSLVTKTFPDLGMVIDLSSTTIAVAASTGVLALALAPLLTARRLSRMDVPSTLRVVE
jgi:putative ABC transport system permease protein